MGILELAKSKNDHSTHITMTQMEEVLPSLKKPLVEAIFADIDAVDDQQGDGKLKITTVIRWVNNKKRRADNIEIKDENFLYNQLKNYQFKDLDIDENGTLDRDEMHAHFDKENVPPEITDILFNHIDSNGDGDISIKEWFQWQMKFKKEHLTELFTKYNEENYMQPDTEEKDTEPEPEKNEPEPEAEKKESEPEVEKQPDPEPEAEKEKEAEAPKQYEFTDNPKGKTNSWSRSKSVDIEFEPIQPEEEDKTPQNNEEKTEEKEAEKEKEKEPEKEKEEEAEAPKKYEITDNPKGKTNSWSRSKSVEMEFDEYDGTENKE